MRLSGKVVSVTGAGSGIGECSAKLFASEGAIVIVNVTGVYIVSKYVIPHMIRQQSGSIINMSSCIAEIGLARRAPYAASKGAILALTKEERT